MKHAHYSSTKVVATSEKVLHPSYRRRVCTSSLPYRISIHNQQLVFSRIVIIWQDSKTSSFLRQVTVIHWQRRFQGLWCDKLPLCKLCNSKYFKNRFEFFRTRPWALGRYREFIPIPDPDSRSQIPDPRSDRFTFESWFQFNSIQFQCMTKGIYRFFIDKVTSFGRNSNQSLKRFYRLSSDSCVLSFLQWTNPSRP